MSVLEFDNANSIFYTSNPPTSDAGVTFVFFNALTGDFGMWEGEIGDALRDAGHGTLSFNFRGQAQSPIGRDVTIDAAQMTADSALVGQTRASYFSRIGPSVSYISPAMLRLSI